MTPAVWWRRAAWSRLLAMPLLPNSLHSLLSLTQRTHRTMSQMQFLLATTLKTTKRFRCRKSSQTWCQNRYAKSVLRASSIFILLCLQPVDNYRLMPGSILQFAVCCFAYAILSLSRLIQAYHDRSNAPCKHACHNIKLPLPWHRISRNYTWYAVCCHDPCRELHRP